MTMAFFVTHNNRETRHWRTRKDLLPGHCEEIENIPHTDASDKDIQELIAKLKTFKEDEFVDLLDSNDRMPAGIKTGLYNTTVNRRWRFNTGGRSMLRQKEAIGMCHGLIAP